LRVCSHLDPGESEAIALAFELSADLILLDEKDGRQAAEHAGLRVTASWEFATRAKKAGQIPSISPELAALHNRARFFVSAQLEKSVLQVAGE
jgi:predicted nucleic acid-binding protein